MPGGLKYWVAYEACLSSVLLMYGADALPLICDQLWFSITIRNTVRRPLECATVTGTALDGSPWNAYVPAAAVDATDSVSALAVPAATLAGAKAAVAPAGSPLAESAICPAPLVDTV